MWSDQLRLTSNDRVTDSCQSLRRGVEHLTGLLTIFKNGAALTGAEGSFLRTAGMWRYFRWTYACCIWNCDWLAGLTSSSSPGRCSVCNKCSFGLKFASEISSWQKRQPWQEGRQTCQAVIMKYTLSTRQIMTRRQVVLRVSYNLPDGFPTGPVGAGWWT